MLDPLRRNATAATSRPTSKASAAVIRTTANLGQIAGAGHWASEEAFGPVLPGNLAVQTRAAGLSDAAPSVFGGSGDIDAGGYANAYTSAQGPGPTIVQNVYTLHPGDPATLAAIADASNAGNNLQTSISSSRTTVNI